MCLIALSLLHHPVYRLALIANRDELHTRPTAPLGVDPDHPEVLGGRDLQSGGGWLMVSARGRFAAVTNVRDGMQAPAAPRSRGALVRGFVGADRSAEHSASATVAALLPHAADYGRFNLLLWDGTTMAYCSNHPHVMQRQVAAGVHGLSNGPLDAPWPKSLHATAALQDWLASPLAMQEDGAALEPLFAALADTRQAADAALPQTHVGLELERHLSPAFVRDAHYGTRCSSIVLVDDHRIRFAERRFDSNGMRVGDTVLAMALQH